MSRWHVFLSYITKNEDLMWKVYNELRMEGLTVWIDQTNLEPGTLSWDRAIEEAIMNAGCFVVLLSPSARRSEWVREELHYAKTLGKRIFPVLANGDAQNAIPFGFSTVQYTDIRDENYASGMHKLIESVCKYLGVESHSSLRARQREQLEAISQHKHRIEQLRQHIQTTVRKRHIAQEQIERMMQEEHQMQAQLDWLAIQRNKMQEDYQLMCQQEKQSQDELITLMNRLRRLSEEIQVDPTIILSTTDSETAAYEYWDTELPTLEDAQQFDDETVSAQWTPIETTDAPPMLLGGYPELPSAVDPDMESVQRRRRSHR